MHAFAPLLTVALIWIVAVITPGPNFLLMLRTSATQSRATSFTTIAGIGTGTLVWGCAGFFGIHALFSAAPWLYVGFKLVGGLYLLLLGVRIWTQRSAPGTAGPVGDSTGLSRSAAYRLGLMTNLANPKSALFVASVFATAMPGHPSLPLGGAAIALMMSISIGWYCTVNWLITRPSVSRAYAGLRRWIDRVAGTVFLIFGAKLVLDR